MTIFFLGLLLLTLQGGEEALVREDKKLAPYYFLLRCAVVQDGGCERGFMGRPIRKGQSREI